uniref:NADH-ubiquinone oxidoreductase chain 2 n=1 Tax=Tyrophagus longior TaxID=223634 RepID=A0A0S2SXE2_TYRLO|nr:NADH dehydrogenase subunit 2 [Tyrophagus longior]ALP46624.1 NADH dehydrogenase subunit 2 [Tyrophagus longior]
MISLLAISTIMGFSSTNWMTIWMRLEVNILAMCSIMSSKSKSMMKSEKSTFMYYLVQVMVSYSNRNWKLLQHKNHLCNKPIVTVCILAKMGVWPIHLWYMKLISLLEMKQSSMLIFMTCQKILPILLMMSITTSEVLQMSMVIMVLGTIVSPMTMLIQNFAMKKIMALTSLNNNWWMLVSWSLSMKSIISFLLIYSFTLMMTLSTMMKMTLKSKSTMKNFWSYTVMVGNIWGLPPLALFWAKILVIKTLMESEMRTEMAGSLILSARHMIYHYLWMAFNEMTWTPTKCQMKTSSMKQQTTMLTLMSVKGLSVSMFMS